MSFLNWSESVYFSKSILIILAHWLNDTYTKKAWNYNFTSKDLQKLIKKNGFPFVLKKHIWSFIQAVNILFTNMEIITLNFGRQDRVKIHDASKYAQEYINPKTRNLHCENIHKNVLTAII